MDTQFSTEPFTVSCPECKKEITKPLNWFNKDIVVCPFCKAVVHTRKFRAQLEAAEQLSAKSRRLH